MKDYKEHRGTYYTTDTAQEVIDVISSLIHTNTRIKIYLGDPQTGRDYCEELDTTGTVSRSTGPKYIPILLATKRSHGGGAISTGIVLKIKETRTGRILYQHPKYKTPHIEITPSDMPEYTHNTVVNGEIYGRHKSLKSAETLKRKLL